MSIIFVASALLTLAAIATPFLFRVAGLSR
jgi:hypothetical protein